MEIQKQSRKVWETPVVEALSIDATLGGGNPNAFETTTFNFGPPPGTTLGPNFGTIPGAGKKGF